MRNNSTFINFLINDFETDAENGELEAEIEELLISLEIGDFCPPPRVVNDILSFACSYEVFESENTGLIETNLN